MPRTTIRLTFSAAGRMPPRSGRTSRPGREVRAGQGADAATGDPPWGQGQAAPLRSTAHTLAWPTLEAELRTRDRLDAAHRACSPSTPSARPRAALCSAPAARAAALALVDIDGFRALNARCGPPAGDAALAAVADAPAATGPRGQTCSAAPAPTRSPCSCPAPTLAGAQRCCERLIVALEARSSPRRRHR